MVIEVSQDDSVCRNIIGRGNVYLNVASLLEN